MLVAPCYIIVYNAFALTGRTRKPGCSTKPRVPLRSALGYAHVALFVPTSSAALGIAFKASLMLCSHLHEQSGQTDNLPVVQRAAFGVEVDADLHYGQS